MSARAVFLEEGYDAASVRAVARRAGVDPGTVRHWFGDKSRLFSAAIGMADIDPGAVARAALDGPLDGIGYRLVCRVLETWDADGAVEGIRLALPAALADPERRALLPQFLGAEILGPIAARLDPGSARLRAALAATQMVGVLLARYVVGVEPIASLPASRVAELVGPAIERYLRGSLDVGAPGSGESLASPGPQEQNSPHGE